jgi:hypothetical protein
MKVVRFIHSDRRSNDPLTEITARNQSGRWSRQLEGVRNDSNDLDACLSSLFANLRNTKVSDIDAKESIDILLLAGFINKHDGGFRALRALL